ncbi:tRNA (guanosine(46)-N7)-methyltransferase TrmB [bacterium]|nr:MAG: tRNA (guanosine(46)-N7)-methyltransferase TrmB [bacterium]
MGRKKLERYQQVKTLPNYYDLLTAPKKNWNEWAFKKEQPIVLELGCGYGEYVVNLAKLYPQKNFLGVDVKAERMFIGLKDVNENELGNAAFFRAPIQFLPDFFNQAEVDELWITFPDPFLKEKKHRRRLTSAYFLGVYRKFLKPGGIINFKTDCDPLFEYTEEVFAEEGDAIEILFKSYDLYNDAQAKPEWLIPTRYEKMYQERGVPIKYVQFRLK